MDRRAREYYNENLTAVNIELRAAYVGWMHVSPKPLGALAI